MMQKPNANTSKSSTWKVDDATAMYWFVMVPHKSPAFWEWPQPGNSAIVTFLGWWSRNPNSKVVGDLQRFGTKKVTAGITWFRFPPRFLLCVFFVPFQDAGVHRFFRHIRKYHQPQLRLFSQMLNGAGIFPYIWPEFMENVRKCG